MDLITRNNVDLKNILQCPTCRNGRLVLLQEKIECHNCKSVFHLKGNIPVLLDREFSAHLIENFFPAMAWENYDKENINKVVAKYSSKEKGIWQKLKLNFRVQLGPTFTQFLEKFEINGNVLELGGGPCSLSREGVVNIDINNYSTVDIIGDARRLPLLDNSIKAVICNSVLEHIWEVELVISETLRILSEGGYAFFCVPLICGRHHTIDYHRWTLPGLIKLFEKYEIMETGTILGPGMFISHLVENIIYSTFNYNFFSKLLNLLVSWLLFPLRFLDFFGKGKSDLENYSHTIYIIARKKYS